RGRAERVLAIRRHVLAPKSARKVPGLKTRQPHGWIGHPLSPPSQHQTHREGPRRSAPTPIPLSNWLRLRLRELAEADVSIRTARGHRIVSETLGARGPQHRRGRGG